MYEFVINCPFSIIDLFGLGTWTVENGSVEPGTHGVSINAPDNGFFVIYTPSPEECPDGTIVLYQIVSLIGAGILHNEPPQVDNPSGLKHHPTTGCPLPPAMTPPLLGPGAAPGSSGYYDAPNNGYNGGTFQFTAVASCREGCKEIKQLSTYYFEFNPNTGQVNTNVNNTNQTQFNNGINTWNK